jgi:hypothetical protein
MEMRLRAVAEKLERRRDRRFLFDDAVQRQCAKDRRRQTVLDARSGLLE